MSDAPLREEGSRSELVAKLHARAEYLWHMGKDYAFVERARAGAERLQAGESSTRVGYTDYVVTEGSTT